MFFDLGVTEQDLNCLDVPWSTINHGSLRSTQRVRAILGFSQTDGRHPLINQALVLPGAHVPLMIDAARKEIFAHRTASPLKPGDQS